MSTLNLLQQQINDAEAKVNELRKKLAAERDIERSQSIAAARELIKIHSLTISELGLSGKSTAKRSSSNGTRVMVAPKYKDPLSGKTWTGRGKTPRWLLAYLSSGKSKIDYLLK